jgi:hypothetical protein
MAVVQPVLGRRLTAAVMCAAVLLVLPATQQPVHVDSRSAAAGPWLTRLNQWRSSTGLSTLTENPTWSAGDYAHAQYMVMNDLVTHYETPGTPYYTTAGDTAARDGNIFVSSTTATGDTQAIDWWMGAPFHSMGLMDPRLSSTGFGSFRYVKSGWQMGAAVDTIRGNSFTGGTYPVYFPGSGSIEPLTQYSGNEWPDPLSACPGYSMPTGLPVFVEVGGNVATTAGPVHTITGNGVSLANCVIDSNNSSLGSYLTERGGVILVPQQPLQNGVKYTVALTVNGVPYTWSFTVGAFSTTPCTNATLSADKASPQAPGTVVTFTGTAAGCPNPEYLFYVQPPGGVWTVMRSYGGPTWSWNTSSFVPGNYLVDLWVRDNGSGVNEESYSLMSFTIGGSCAIAAVTPDKPSPQGVGAQVTFTATSTGCGTPEYLFYLQSPGTGWALMRGYGIGSWTWNTSTVPSIGNFLVDVWVRPAGSTAPYQAYSLLSYTLINAPCTGVSLTPSLPSPQVHGAVITFTATATGCSYPEYQFFLQAPGTNAGWTLVRAYGGPTWSWSTAGVASVGPYQIDVWARAVGTGVSEQAYSLMSYNLN